MEGIFLVNMDGRKIIKHFTTIGIGTVLGMVVGLISTMTITRMVDTVEYGKLSIFLLYSNIAETVLVIGLDQALMRFYYKDTNIVYKHGLLLKCTKAPLILSLIAAASFMLLVTMNLIPFELDGIGAALLCALSVLLIGNRFSVLLLRMEYKSKLYSLMNVFQKATYLSCAVLLLSMHLVEEHYSLMIATVLSYFVVVLLSCIAMRRIWLCGIKDNASVPTYRALFNYSWPFVLSMGITMFFNAIDKLSLQHFCDYSVVGVYTSSLNLVALFSVLQITFTSLWTPLTVEHYQKEPNDTSLYIRGNQVITILMFSLGFLLIAIKDLFALILGEKYREAAYILPFLIFNPIMYTISETTVIGITFQKKSIYHVIIAAVSCLVNLCGNTILVPRIGAKGAAISTGLSYILFFTLRTVFSQKYYPVKFELWKIYVLVVLAIGFSAYNTFVLFNYKVLIGLALCLAAIVLLYRETVGFMISKIQKLIGSFFNH